MNFAQLAIRNKTVVLSLSLVLVVAGVVAYQRLGRLEYPDFTIKTAIVMTSYPGAAPMEVSEEVSDVLEEAVQQIDALDEVRSISQEGLSILYVDIKDQFKADELPQVWDELRRKVNDAQGKLPPGAGPSVVNDDFGDVYGVFFALTGEDYSMHDLRKYAEELKRELLLVQDVSKVAFWGIQQEVIYVEMKRSQMAEMGVSPKQIAATLAQQNIVAPSGQAKVEQEWIRIDPTGEFESVEAIGDLLIRGRGTESMVRLRDVATVHRGYEEPARTKMLLDGKPAIGLGISTVAGGNVVTMGEAVGKRLEELKATAPPGLELFMVADQSHTVSEAVNGFVLNLLEAVAIVVILLLVFMGLRTGLLIGVILVLTILTTFAFMKLWGINLQKISLGALIIALGMLVDNAIVVAEGVLVRVRMGEKSKPASIAAVMETKWPLLGATLVAILAFAAIGFSDGNVGEFCRSLFYVIAISLMVSWVLAVTLTPVLCSILLKPKPIKTVTDPYAGRFYQVYRRLLVWCLHHRWKVVMTMGAMLIAAGIGFTHVENSFFPDSTRPQFYIDYWRPQGTHIDETSADLKAISEHLQTLDGVTSVAGFAGQGALRFVLPYDSQMPNNSYGQLLVTVNDYRTIPDLMHHIESYLRANYPDSEPKIRPFINGPGGGAKIEARFRGPDPKVLRELSAQAQTIMRADAGTRDVRDNWRQPVKVIRPHISQSQARRTGVSAQDVRAAIQVQFGGSRIGIYRENDDLLPIVVRRVSTDRKTIGSMNNMQIFASATGKYVPFQQVISEVANEWEDAILRRRNRQLTITTQCDQVSGNASPVFLRLRPLIEAIEVPPGYEMEWGGEFEHSAEAQAPLAALFPLCILGMFLLTLTLFNAIRPPIIIFLCLPLALIGVTAGLLVMGKPFGFMAILGFLSLSGMLIKNAIVLIEQIAIEQKKRKSDYLAVVDSGVSRIRPVMMGSLTTVLGMAPLLFDPFFDAMAVTIMAGLLFATLLTLVIVPVLYVSFYRIHPED